MTSLEVTDFLPDDPAFHDAASISKGFSNWDWPDNGRRGWEIADREWQDFAGKWRKINKDVFKSQVLDLSSAPWDEDCHLFIRDCYVKAEEVVWRRAVKHPLTGVIFTGQPGIGKTFFLYYLLVRLLRMGQVVLFQPPSSTDCILFWHDAVYVCHKSASVSLPRHSIAPRSFIWSLLDPHSLTLRKGRSPHYSQPLQSGVFRSKHPYPLRFTTRDGGRNDVPFLPPSHYGPVKSLYALYPFRTYLNEAMERWEDFPKSKNDHSYRGAVSLLHETHEENPESTDEALGILLDILIERFGTIPRDTSMAMFGLQEMVLLHEPALPGRLESLRQIQRQITPVQPSTATSSHHLISINPMDEVGELVRWTVEFRSVDIGKQVSERLFTESDRTVLM